MAEAITTAAERDAKNPTQLEIVARVLKLTLDDKLKWRVTHQSSVSADHFSPDDAISDIFEADYKGKILKLTVWGYATSIGQLVETWTNTPGSRRQTIQRLELTDEDGAIVWTFPRFNMLRDLETSVRFQVANIQQFVSDIFAEA